MDFDKNKTPVEVIKEGAFGGTYSKTFILVLMESGTKSHGQNLISRKILIGSIISKVIMMLVLINMLLNVEHRYILGK